MRFYTQQHRHYCGIDFHARTMYVRIIGQDGAVLVEKNIPSRPGPFLNLVAPYRDDLVVAVECIFTWYWLADLCHEEGITFVLGHALYMKAIHGGKAKNDKIDAGKMATLLRGGMLPYAYVYPREMRATRDLLRRRLHLVRHRGRLLAHIQNTNHQCNHDDFRAKLTYKANREGVAERFEDPSMRQSVEIDLASTILYEVHDIQRFETVQQFASYSRLVKFARESAGKREGTGGAKIGNVHLKWAFSEAAVLYLRANPAGQKYLARLTKKHCKGKALSILAHKLGRATFHVMKNSRIFDDKKFLAA